MRLTPFQILLVVALLSLIGAVLCSRRAARAARNAPDWKGPPYMAGDPVAGEDDGPGLASLFKAYPPAVRRPHRWAVVFMAMFIASLIALVILG